MLKAFFEAIGMAGFLIGLMCVCGGIGHVIQKYIQKGGDTGKYEPDGKIVYFPDGTVHKQENRKRNKRA